MATTSRTSRQERNARRLATADPKVSKFALLSETLLLGVCLFVLALPIVSAPAAYAAGAAHMERHISGRADTISSLWADFKTALPGSWKLGVVLLSAGVAAFLNMLLAGSNQLPGGKVVLAATVVLAVGLMVLLLRSAGLWHHYYAALGRGSAAANSRSAWLDAWTQAKNDTAKDWIGSVLLIAALGMCLSFVWMLPPLVFIVPGAMTLAVVSVRFRQRALAG